MTNQVEKRRFPSLLYLSLAGYNDVTYVDWYFHRVRMTEHYKMAPLFPPPLNLLTFVPTILARICQDAKQRRTGHGIFDRCPPQFEAKALHKNDRARRQRRKVVEQYFKRRWKAEKRHNQMLEKASTESMRDSGSSTRHHVKQLNSKVNAAAENVTQVDYRIARLREDTNTRFDKLDDQTKEQFDNMKRMILDLRKLLKEQTKKEEQQQQHQQPSNTDGGGE